MSYEDGWYIIKGVYDGDEKVVASEVASSILNLVDLALLTILLFDLTKTNINNP